MKQRSFFQDSVLGFLGAAVGVGLVVVFVAGRRLRSSKKSYARSERTIQRETKKFTAQYQNGHRVLVMSQKGSA